MHRTHDQAQFDQIMAEGRAKPLSPKQKADKRKAGPRKAVKSGKVVPGQTPGPKTAVKIKRRAF